VLSDSRRAPGRRTFEGKSVGDCGYTSVNGPDRTIEEELPVRVRDFRVAFVVTACCLLTATAVAGAQGLMVAATLGVLEIALSFDNAIVNATVLARLSVFWQRIFLTVGILIAAVGMRLVVPLIVIAIATHLEPGKALNLALHHPLAYHAHLVAVQPLIAAFGGTFLLMIFMDFMVDEHDVHWLGPIERGFTALGRIPQLPAITSAAFLLLASATFARERAVGVLVAGGLGLVLYVSIQKLGDLMERRSHHDEDEGPRPLATGKAAVLLFCYLELLDATFSFDGVMAAFSVSVDIILITLGLAIGAAYIRSLTVAMVRARVLDRYIYLEHGAYYAIGTLAVLLLIEIGRDVPDGLTALVSVALIGAAYLSSVVHNRTTLSP
jgi:uncharacterized protein